MAQKQTLAQDFVRYVELDYVRTDRVRSVRRVTVVRIEGYDAADGSYRVSLRCREDGQRTLKDFLSHRILGIVDLITGEVVSDIPAYLSATIAEAGGVQPRKWPRPSDIPFRTTSIDISFGQSGFAVGWVFGVHSAFRSALDITFHRGATPRTGEWTQGVPPYYAFTTGDLFHSPFPFGPATKHSIQVGDVNDQELVIKIMDIDGGRVAQTVERTITQAQLVEVLRFGLERLPQDDETEAADTAAEPAQELA